MVVENFPRHGPARKYDLVTCGVIALFLSAPTGRPAVARAEQPLLEPAPGSPIRVAGEPSNLVLGDVNADDKPDLVVASGQEVTVLLGEGNGRFRTARGSPLPLPAPPGEMGLGDLNGDRSLDLAIASHDSYNATLLWGDGTGGFALAPTSPVVMRTGQHPHTHGLNIGDLNGDGKLDLVTVNSTDNDLSVALGDGSGGFKPAPGSPFSVGRSPYPAALGDLDHDGRVDIVATNTAFGPSRDQNLASTRALTVLLNKKDGFRASKIPLRTIAPWSVAVADLNADSKPDLAATHAERSELTVLLGDGQGGFTESTGSPFDLGHSAWRMDLADVNRDGKPDVVAAAGEGVRVMLGDGQGAFRPAPGSPFATGKGTWRVALGDVNGDGKIDVATSNLESGSVTVLLGR